MSAVALDAEISLLLYRMGPVALRELMVKVARFIRERNIGRIRAQQNGDGSAYQARKSGGQHRMLTGYIRRISQRVSMDQAVVGVFGRLGNFGAVHDQGKTERRITYPARNILALPEGDKQIVLQMIRDHVAGLTAGAAA